MLRLLYNRKASAALASLGAGGRLPHALLLEGPAGSGRHLAAAVAAQYALCTAPEKPCGVCAACVKVEKRVHPDVRYYGVPEGKKEFPIDLVRQIRQDAYIAPNEGACKLYVIEQAHAMNAAAQNALLKVIEEPPAHARFVLLCENRSMLLPTVLSRVTAIELEVPSAQQCAQALETLAPNASEAERQAAAAGAGGNIGRALELLGSAKPSKAAADARKLRDALVFEDRYQSLRLLAAYDKDRQGLLDLLTLLQEGFAQAALMRYRPAAEQEERLINRLTCEQAINAAQTVAQALQRAGRNVSVPLLCACMVEQIKGAVGG